MCEPGRSHSFMFHAGDCYAAEAYGQKTESLSSLAI